MKKTNGQRGTAANLRRVAAMLLVSHALVMMLWPTQSAAQTTFPPTTGNATNGAATYAQCTGCHGASGTSSIAIRNGANAGRLINLAMANGMGGYSAASFNNTQEDDLAAHIATFFSSPNPNGQAVPFNSAGTGLALPNIYLGTSYGAYSAIVTTASGARGSVSYSGTTATYVPTTGQCGTDTFSWRAQGNIDTPGGAVVLDTYQSSTRSSSINIANPAVPNIASSGGSITGTYNSAIATYTPVSTGGPPYSYIISAGALPSGLTLNANGTITGTPTQAGSFPVTLAARNCLNGTLNNQSGSRAISITIAQLPQAITFNTLSDKVTSDGPFSVSASGGASGNPVTFSASGVCSSGGTNGATITLTGAVGTCTVTANQAASTNYTAASAVARSFNVVDASAELFPPACAVPPGWLKPIGVTYGWSATSEAGAASQGTCGLKSDPMPIAAPGTTNKAAIALLATFDPGNIVFQRRVGSEAGWDCFRLQIDGVSQGTPSACFGSDEVGVSGIAPYGAVSFPITAGSHTVTYSYETDDTNQFNGDAAWIDQVAMPLSTSVVSATLATGTFGSAFAYFITGTNFPLTFGATGLPPGLSVNSSTGLISGVPGAAGNFTVMASVSNPAAVNPSATDIKAITFLINKASQAISFAALSNRLTTSPAFNVSAIGGSSGNAVTFAASGVCSSSGTNGSLITLTGNPGTCSVTASQLGNANYSDASDIIQSFQVSAPANELFPPACNMPAGWTVPGGSTTGWMVASNENSTEGGCSLRPMFLADAGTLLQANIQISGTFAAGTIRFNYKVSSENTWDCFQFLIDGAAQGLGGSCANRPGLTGVSGEAGWTTVSLPITAGAHTLTWRYDKDSVCCTGGSDAVWIDEVVLPQFTLTVSKAGSGTGTVTSSPSGINCGGTCSANLSGSVALTPTPSFLSFFAGWSGACSGTGSCTVSMTAARAVTATFSAATAPTAPQNVVATPGNTQASIAFTAPASDGGSPITAYGVTCTAAGQTTRINSGSSSPIVVTSMVNGVQYSCAVAAGNFAGTGPATNVNVTPRTVPGAPASVVPSTADGQVSLAFTAPASNGGSTITGYTATCVASGQTTRIGTAAASPVLVTSMVNGVQYDCGLVANNVAGSSTPALVSVTPGAAPTPPTSPVVTVFDGRATINFTPSASDNGSPISGYTLTCNPGAISAGNISTPISIAGLTNGTLYTCTVAATNAIGSTPSLAFSFTPSVRAGVALWADVCANCHAPTPTGAQLNAAGPAITTLNHVIVNQPTMAATPLVTLLTTAERTAIAAYIASQVPTTAETTPFNTPKLIDVSNRLTIGGVAFNSVVAGASLPAHGSLSVFGGATVTYTPAAGYIGTDTFTVTGSHDSPPIFLGSQITINVVVLPPPSPVITSPAAANGTNGVAFSYQISATNNPTSFSASGLPTGVSVNTGNGAISGTPTVGGVFSATISATNAGGTGSTTLMISLNAGNQTIDFPVQSTPSRSFAPSPGNTFSITPLASATSGLAVTYSSLFTGVCTVSATTVTILSAGTCRIAANQSGNVSFNVAPEVTRDIAITAIAPGAPVIGAATAGNLQATIAFSAPANTGGGTITGYSATCTPSGSGSNTSSPIVVSGLSNGTLYTCSVRASNSAGTGPASGNVTVTPAPTPTAPIITSANNATFTVGVLGSFSVQASSNPAAAIGIQSGSLPAGVSINAGVISGTPAAAGPTVITLVASNGVPPDATQVFTLNVAKAAQTIFFTGPSTQVFSPAAVPLSATASSGLTVTYVSNSGGVCTVAGASVTLVGLGTCSITAQQAGNANFLAATGVTQTFSVVQGGQTISFPAQTPRTYASGASFGITAATASSGLAVTYSSLTSTVCTVSGANYTIIRAGQCTLAANQGGSGNYSAAAQVTQNVTISGAVPGAPIIGTAVSGDSKATVSFTPPANDGGFTITSYSATCGAVTANGPASPIVVSGLANGALVQCSVKANNAAGASLASGNTPVTPAALPGAAVWAATCGNAGCHGNPPVGTRLNVGGSATAVIDYAIANQITMSMNPALTGMNASDRQAVAEYIRDFIPPVAVAVPFNTPTQVDVSSQVYLNTFVVAFTSLQVVSGPAHGSLSAFTDTTATYTPNAGYTGADTFTYRATRAGLNSDVRTVSLNVAEAAPVIVSPATASGALLQVFNYQIVATSGPTSYGASGLPNGLAVNPSTGLISGTPTQSGVFNATISATNSGNTGSAGLSITIGLAPQVITFGAQSSPRAFVAGGGFAIAPTASGGASGNAIVYSSITPGVCSASAGTAVMLSAGLCTIAANQAGNATYAAAAQVTQGVTITPVAPGPPVIGVATAGNTQAGIAFNPPASNGGSAITGYTATCGAISVPGPSSPITVSGLVNGTPYTCSVTATNAAGTGVASGTVMVTPIALSYTGNVFSRKTHGAAGDKDLPLNGAAAIGGAITVEPRAGTSGHRIVFVFNNPVTSVTSLSVVDALGAAVGIATPSYNGNELVVNISGMPDNQRATISATGVNGALSVQVSMGFLVGDVSSSKAVNAVDISAVRARGNTATNNTNFIYDLDANGTIGTSDVTAVKARSGLVMP
ncbi:MAG: fibronectin type III domain-containing protein [Betaproteobacteria bacterium]